MFKAFLTGSRAYDTPHADSDIDLVVCIDKDSTRILLDGMSDTPYRATKFGKLNLIMLDEEDYAKWAKVNAELIARKPVTRAEAVKAFDAEGVGGGRSGGDDNEEKCADDAAFLNDVAF
jgi:hypothetical protein